MWLRVRNHSQEAFTHVWQGLPQQGTDVDLGPLLPGDTSRWHALPATLAHYRKTRLQIGQRQFTHVADTSFPGGRATLAPGHYTVHLAWVRQPALAALPQTLRRNMAGIEVDGSARLVTLRR